jgi:hypothetical protein
LLVALNLVTFLDPILGLSQSRQGSSFAKTIGP